MRRLRTVARFSLGGTIAMSTLALVIAVAIDLRIRSYDAAYLKVDVGRHDVNDIIVLFGRPQEVTEHPTYWRDVAKVYDYTVRRPLDWPITWRFGLDSEGKVIHQHRQDDPC